MAHVDFSFEEHNPKKKWGKKKSKEECFFSLFFFPILALSGYRTASVIIALTDGELRENQFDLAQREVRRMYFPSSLFLAITHQQMEHKET